MAVCFGASVLVTIRGVYYLYKDSTTNPYPATIETCCRKRPPFDYINAVYAHATECVICRDLHANTKLRPCGHSDFCSECTYTALGNNQRCPLCRQTVHSVTVYYRNPN